MKEFVVFIVVLLCTLSGNAQHYEKPRIYVNPITYSSGSNITQAECLSVRNNYFMGLSKAKHVSIIRGQEKYTTQMAKQKGFDYLLIINVNSISTKKDELFSTKDESRYSGTCVVGHKLISTKTGKSIIIDEITGKSSNAVEDMARFESTTSLNDDALAMIDDALPIVATQINIEEVDDDKIKTAIINLGSEAGARKGMMFIIQQTKGNETTELATARLEQVLANNLSRINIYSKKGGEKKLLDLMNNADESTIITAKSRSLNSMAAWGKNILTSLGVKQEEKGDSYPSDINRKEKPKVALYHIYCSSLLSDAVKNTFYKTISESFTSCSTIKTGQTNAKSIEEAAEEGWDALIDVTITNASSKRGKDVKTADGTKPVYNGSVTISLYAIDVATQAGINLRNITEVASGETSDQAIASAFKQVAKPAKKYFEDVFPVEGKIESVTKSNKQGNDAKEASLSIGSIMGVQKNMKFDIFKQNLLIGEDSREKIGYGEVKKTPEDGASILVIQSGGKQVASIIQSDDPDVGIIVVSRGHVDKFGSILKGLVGLGKLF